MSKVTTEVKPGPGSGPDGNGSDVHAAIDIGTNSIHLVVARADSNGGFEVLTTDKEVVRLGEGSGEMRCLTPAAMDRGIAALRRFRQIADAYNADAAAVATSAVREATNRQEFLDRALDEAGIHVDVIAGVEEARLIHLGVLQALPVFDEQLLVVDIGGGSTEFIVGQGTEIVDARSLKLGHIRLTDRFFPDGIVEPGSLAACQRWVRNALAPAGLVLGAHGHSVAVGSSGTIGACAQMVSAVGQHAGDRREISREALSKLVDELASHRDPESRAGAIRGLERRRADVIVGGAVLLEQIFVAFDVDTMQHSPFALREGVLLDRAHGDEGGFHHLNNIRRESVLRFADAYEEDRSHVEHITDLSLELFDGLQSRHGYDLFERDILEAAGLLHNVGLFVSHAAHHKHSWYIIRNSDRLAGFTDREIELIAQVARYHRRSAPKPTHDTFMALPEADRQRVKLLAGILRIAIALDRTRSQAVQDVLVSPPEGAEMITIECVLSEGADAELERYTARERAGLLGDALGAPVTIT